MNKYNIVKEVALLTTIAERNIRKIIEKQIFAINEAVVEATLADTNVVELDIGIGTIVLRIEGEKVVYRFEPSAQLEESIKNSIINQQNLLEDALDDALVARLTHIYKELF